MIKLIVKIFFIFVLTISFLHAHSNKKKSLKSHEHGVGTLNIAQDENTIIFEFEIPGSDIVGIIVDGDVVSGKKEIEFVRTSPEETEAEPELKRAP